MPKEEKEIEKKVEDAPVPTAEELEAMAAAVNAEMFNNDNLQRHSAKKKEDKKEPPKEEKKEEKKPETEAKKEDGKEPPKEEKKEEEKPKVKKKPPAPVIEEDEVDDLIDKKLEEKLAKKEPEPEKREEKKEAAIDLNPEETATLARLEWISKNDPSFKGRDLVAETKRFWSAEQAYISRWEKDHPDEQFDADSEEHSAFYARNEPNISEDHLTRAAVDMRVAEAEKRIEEKAAKESNKRKDEEAAKQTFEKAKPLIDESVGASIHDLVVSAVPEFEKLMEDGAITQEAFKKMEEEDPVALQVLNQEAGKLAESVREIDTLIYCGQYYPIDRSNPIHQEIIQVGRRLEAAILDKPPEEQKHEGKRFLSQKDFNGRIQEINGKKVSVQEKRSQVDRFLDRYWTVDLESIKTVLIAKSANEVKKTLELTEKRIKHLESKKAKSEKKDEKQTDQNPPNPEKKLDKKPPAAISSTSDLVDTRIPSPQVDADSAKIIDAAMWS